MFVFASLCVFFLIFLSHCFMKCVIQVSAGMYLCPHFLLIDRPSCDFFFFVLVDFWCESAFVSLANSNLCLWRIPYSFFLYFTYSVVAMCRSDFVRKDDWH